MSERTEAFQQPQEWDAVSAKYERAFVKVSRKFAGHAMRVVGLEPGMRVLDVAAGTGALSLAAARAGAQVDAIDFSPAMVERLRANAAAEGVEGVTVHEMDGQALTFADGTFDRAFSIFGLMFFPDRGKGFAEMHRVLKPGGWAAAVLWNRPERVGNLRLLGEALREAAPDLDIPQGPAPWQELEDAARFERELRAVGFRNAKVHTIEETWEAASPAAFWDDHVGMTPALEVLYRRVGAERMQHVEAAFIRRITERYGDGPVSMPGEAHIGVGQK